MIVAYSQRILPPYSGVVQIAESERARAQSFDGISWEIHYLAGNDQSNPQQKRVKGYALDRSFFRVANIKNQQITPYVFPSFLDPTDITKSIDELSEFLSTAQIPFPSADIYEYWLLDATDDLPLALILSCCDESLMSTYPTRNDWTALPHSKMKIENTPAEQARHETPVNDRFQRLVSRRAGIKPRGAWFKRNPDETEDFPCFLVREDWQNEAEHDLCQRYLTRKAPRLLMLQGLTENDRERMEIAAKKYVFEVDQYFPLYPEVNDERRMSAMRVEARLRRDAPEEPKVDDKKKVSIDTPFSKDMRILE